MANKRFLHTVLRQNICHKRMLRRMRRIGFAIDRVLATNLRHRWLKNPIFDPLAAVAMNQRQMSPNHIQPRSHAQRPS